MADPWLVIAIFLLGASAGSLLTNIRYRHELNHLKAQIEEVRNQLDREGSRLSQGEEANCPVYLRK